jgi:hypothetical protein
MNDDEKISKPVLILVGLILFVPILAYYLISMTIDANSFGDTNLERQLTPLDIDHEKTLPNKNLRNSTVRQSLIKANAKSYKAQALDVNPLFESNPGDGEQEVQETVDAEYPYEEEMLQESTEGIQSYENYEEMQREIAAEEDLYQDEHRLQIEDYLLLSEEEAADLERASRNRPEVYSQNFDSDPETEYQD